MDAVFTAVTLVRERNEQFFACIVHDFVVAVIAGLA